MFARTRQPIDAKSRSRPVANRVNRAVYAARLPGTAVGGSRDRRTATDVGESRAPREHSTETVPPCASLALW